MVKGLHRGGKAVKLCAACAVFVLTFAVLEMPFPQKTAKGTEYAEAQWENGSRTRESYASVLMAYSDCTAQKILLEREGLRGEISVSGRFSDCYRLLDGGDFEELSAASFALPRIEAPALFRKFGNVCYYHAGEAYAYDGVFAPTQRSKFSEVALSAGGISAETLQNTGAEVLSVCADAQVSGASLFGTRIRKFRASAPYETAEGVLFLHTPGGTRIVAALPAAETLTVGGADFCDGGALLPCRSLSALCLPFVGSAKSSAGSDYDGRLQYMFAERVPDTLKRVKVTGGSLETFAFEGCPNIEEIDLCGLPESEISPDAFVGCYGLKKLHTSLKNPHLKGNFSQTILPCGCLLYEREET